MKTLTKKEIDELYGTLLIRNPHMEEEIKALCAMATEYETMLTCVAARLVNGTAGA